LSVSFRRERPLSFECLFCAWCFSAWVLTSSSRFTPDYLVHMRRSRPHRLLLSLLRVLTAANRLHEVPGATPSLARLRYKHPEGTQAPGSCDRWSSDLYNRSLHSVAVAPTALAPSTNDASAGPQVPQQSTAALACTSSQHLDSLYYSFPSFGTKLLNLAQARLSFPTAAGSQSLTTCTYTCAALHPPTLSSSQTRLPHSHTSTITLQPIPPSIP
jgi:hypothetical protein